MQIDKRTAIYFFFDEEGVVDDYNIYLLQDLIKSLTRLVVVVNGKLNSEGRAKLLKVVDKKDLVVRENIGFDSWAYKAGLEHLGWDEVRSNDELIMLNHTNFGPIYPFAEAFEEMDRREDDFWGLTKHNKIDSDPFGCIEYGYLPEHIQSHFVAYRKRLLNSEAFHEYWEKLPMIHNYNEAVGLHEARQTKHYADMGFTWSVYSDIPETADTVCYPLMSCPLEMVKNRRCPIIKRKTFCFQYEYYIMNTNGSEGHDLYAYLRDHTDYPVKMIMENMIRTMPMPEVNQGMQLRSIFPEDGQVLENGLTATLCMVLTREKTDRLAIEKAMNLPANTQILVAVESETHKKAFAKLAAEAGLKAKVFVADEKEIELRDLLAIFGHRNDSWNDIVFFANDVQESFVYIDTVGDGFVTRGFNAQLGTKALAGRIMEAFSKDPMLGLMIVPQTPHGNYYSVYGTESNASPELIRPLLKELGVKVPVSKTNDPIRVRDGFFAVRGSVIRTLCAQRSRIFTLTEEHKQLPPVRSSFLHSLYAFEAQRQGMYTAFGNGTSTARIDAANTEYLLMTVNRQLASVSHQYNYRIQCDWLESMLPNSKKKVAGVPKLKKPTVLKASRMTAFKLLLTGKMNPAYLKDAVMRRIEHRPPRVTKANKD